MTRFVCVCVCVWGKGEWRQQKNNAQITLKIIFAIFYLSIFCLWSRQLETTTNCTPDMKKPRFSRIHSLFLTVFLSFSLSLFLSLFFCNGIRWPLFYSLHHNSQSLIINYLCVLDTTLRILNTWYNVMFYISFLGFLSL